MNARWRGAALPLLALAAWSAADLLIPTHGPLFVSPSRLVAEMGRVGIDPAFWAALGASLARAFFGMLIGGAAGLATGIALGLSRTLDLTLQPSLQALKSISLFAWIPLVMAWFGLAEAAKLSLIALASFFPMFLNSFDGVRAIPRQWAELGRAYRYSPVQTARAIILPAALPAVFTGLHLTLVYGWLATLGAEYMLTSSVGMGNLLNDAREELRLDHLLIYITAVGLVGYGLTQLLNAVEALLLGQRADAPQTLVAI